MIYSTLTPPTIDQAAIDRGIARAKRERSRAIVSMIRSLFRRPAATVRPATRTAMV